MRFCSYIAIHAPANCNAFLSHSLAKYVPALNCQIHHSLCTSYLTGSETNQNAQNSIVMHEQFLFCFVFHFCFHSGFYNMLMEPKLSMSWVLKLYRNS